MLFAMRMAYALTRGRPQRRRLRAAAGVEALETRWLLSAAEIAPASSTINPQDLVGHWNVDTRDQNNAWYPSQWDISIDGKEKKLIVKVTMSGKKPFQFKTKLPDTIPNPYEMDLKKYFSKGKITFVSPTEFTGEAKTPLGNFTFHGTKS